MVSKELCSKWPGPPSLPLSSSPKIAKLSTIALAIGLVIVAPSFASSSGIMAYAEPAQTISKVRSGLVASDLLNDGVMDTSYWTVYGSAAEQQAPYQSRENSTGLHLGVKAKTGGTWAGLFAVSPATSTQLFHAVLTVPSALPANNMFDTALYIQTTQPFINSVSCAANVTPGGYYWLVGWGQGNANVQTQFTTLWVDTSPNQPPTRDCTIITNGDNLLTVYMDGALVYSANNLKLNVSPPFNAYLEPQTSFSGQMLFGAYRDYYATSSNAVTVTNTPKDAVVKVIDASSNAVLASSKASEGGVAVLDIGKYHFPLRNASIKLYDSQGAQVLASTADGGGGAIWGGDEYIVGNPPPVTAAALTVKTEAIMQKPLAGMWTVLSSQNGQIVATGFSPVTFNVTSGQQYVVTVYNYGQYAFDHWKDMRSANPSRIVTINGDTQVVAVYRAAT